MGLLERIAEARSADVARVERRNSIDMWLSDYLVPSMNQWGYNNGGLTTTWINGRVQEYSGTLPGHSAAVRACPPAFAAQMVRALVISQARFTFRNLPSANQPRKTFGTQALGVLERPWRNATTGELLSRMEWHAGLAGNSFVTNYWPGRLRVLRPDWVGIVYGSKQEPDDAAFALDGEVIGYAYCNGGFAGAGRNDVTMLLPDEVAHWSPIPDPEGAGIGMSWISVALRDMQGDRAATEHKLKFFTNGATPNMVVKGIPAVDREKFDMYVDMMEARHAGLGNAYKTLYLAAGADATVVGSDLKQLDFKATQGAGETRVAMLGRVPAPLLGISEGLAGSSLNAGNFGMARRIFGDTWIYPTLQDLAAALAPLINVPPGAELWTDTADMPILREDAKDAAEIEQIKQTTINGYVREGWEPESAKAAVRAQDISLLKHSGLVSVQLQPPGTTADTMQSAGGSGPKVPAAQRSWVARKFNPDQPRVPGGHEGGGQWGSFGGILDGLASAIMSLDEFNASYGDPIDQRDVDNFSVFYFDNGDIALTTSVADADETHLAVLYDGDSARIRGLAEELKWASLMGANVPDDAEADEDNGLVQWVQLEDGSDTIVGYDVSGDVRVSFPANDEESDDFDMSNESADELADALNELADANDENQDSDDEDRATRADSPKPQSPKAGKRRKRRMPRRVPRSMYAKKTKKTKKTKTHSPPQPA